MKINLNLLPEGKKKTILKKKVIKMIFWQEVMFVFSVVVFVAMLFSTNVILKTQLKSAEEIFSASEDQENSQEAKKYEDFFTQINSKVTFIEKIQSKQLNWSNFFLELNQTISPGILINDISTKDYSISLGGVADNREDLVFFEGSIEKSDCFFDVNSITLFRSNSAGQLKGFSGFIILRALSASCTASSSLIHSSALTQ